MKKILSVLLVLCMMATMAVAENVDFTGDWYLRSMVAEGMELDASLLGLEIAMSLVPDGTSTMTAGDEVSVGTWAAVGGVLTVIDETGESMEFTMDEEGKLVCVDVENEMSLVFSREQGEEEAFVMPEAVPVEDIKDYDGLWAATGMYIMGMVLPVDTLGVSMTLNIQDGVVIVTDETESQTELKAELIDGQLVCTAAEEVEGEASVLALYLSVDGTIILNMEELGACVIFERQIVE